MHKSLLLTTILVLSSCAQFSEQVEKWKTPDVPYEAVKDERPVSPIALQGHPEEVDREVLLQRKVKWKALNKNVKINGDGEIIFLSNRDTWAVTDINYEIFSAIIEKAVEWDKSKKDSDIEKELFPSITKEVTMRYIYQKEPNKSYISTCFYDGRYSEIKVGLECVHFNNYQKLLKDIKRAPSAIELINKEIDSAEKLR